MADTVILLGAGIAALLGFAWLALAMEGHWQQVHGTATAGRTSPLLLRTMGAFGLLGCGVLSFVASRPSMALLLWIMLLAWAAVAVALTLAWKPALLRLTWPARSLPGR